MQTQQAKYISLNANRFGTSASILCTYLNMLNKQWGIIIKPMHGRYLYWAIPYKSCSQEKVDNHRTSPFTTPDS